MTETQEQTANGVNSQERAPQRFVASSMVREVVRREIQAFADRVLAPAIGQSVAELMREIEAQFAARLAAIEAAAKEFAFRGQWAENAKFHRNNFVTMGGALFYCNVDSTQARPGTNGDWVLVFPKPRDGRDGCDGKDAAPTEPSEPRTTKSHR